MRAMDLIEPKHVRIDCEIVTIKWILLPALKICFLHHQKICEWTFIILLTRTKEVRIFRKTFFRWDWVV